jgi:hypothetical protein
MFRVYELADGASATCDVPGPGGVSGVRCTVSRNGRQIDATIEGKRIGDWRVQLAGVPAVGVPAGARGTRGPLGVIIAAARGTRSLRLRLPAGGARR